MLAARVYESESEVREDPQAVRLEIPEGTPEQITALYHIAGKRLFVCITALKWNVVHRTYADGEFERELSILLRDPWDGLDVG